MTTTLLRLAPVLIGIVLSACGGAPAPAPTTPTPPPPDEGAAASAEGSAARAPGCAPIPWTDDENAGAATYAGTLDVITAGLPNETTEQVYVLALERPACLPASSDAKETDQIQVFSPDAPVHAQLAANKGKRITVTGEGFTPHTAHHHRPIVVSVTSVVAK